MESPRVLAVLKFGKEVLDAMKRVENQDDMATFSLKLHILCLVCNRLQQQQQLTS